MPTPIILDQLLYTCNDNGRLTVRDALTGDLQYRQRIGKGRRTYSASAVAAGGKIYFASETGKVTVIGAGREFTLLAENDLPGETLMETPAIAGDRLLIRTAGNLYCFQPAAER